MASRDEFLFYARRMHNAFRVLINNGGDSSSHWHKNPELCAHHLCGVYVTGALTFLEGRYGKNAWNQSGKTHSDFGSFVLSSKRLKGPSKDQLDAFVCIRNAVVHNNCDLSKNNDPHSLSKVTNASLGATVSLNGSVFTLVSNGTHDFMELVRLAIVGVAQYHGDG